MYITFSFSNSNADWNWNIHRNGIYKIVQILPESFSKPQPDYIPQAIRDDYYEACLICDKSPKAAAALARRALQGMIRDFWGIARNTLAQEITDLEKQEPNIKELIDPIRIIGNIGAHMEKDVNLIIPIEPEEARLLIELLEELFEEWYVERNKKQQRRLNIQKVTEEKKQLQKTKNTEEQ